MSSRATLGIAIVLFVLALFGPWSPLSEPPAPPSLPDPRIETGTAALTAGETAAVVSHDLGFTPARVLLTPQSEHTSSWWVGDRNAATFEIRTSATSTADVLFDWRASEE